MYEEMQNHVDSFLPKVSNEMKDVFPDVEPYTTMNNTAASNGDFANGSIPTLDTQPPQETSFETLDDTDVERWFSLYNQSEPSFSILPSKKERGKPYFIDDKKRILTTKKNEPVHIQLDFCKPGQKILLTLRYFDQDYYDRPMVCNGCGHAYKSCSSNEDHNEANFCVKSRDGSVQYMQLLDGAAYHPTAVITVAVKEKTVDLYAAFKCRNSCSEHKKYGSDRTLRLVLLDEQQQELCRNEWNLRVCESAKRDHNLVLSKAGSNRSDSASELPAPRQPNGLSPPTPVTLQSSALVQAADAEIQPPPMKRVKLEEESIILYTDNAPSSTQQTRAGPTVFRCVPSPIIAHSSHAGYRKNGNNTAFPMSSSRSSGVVSVPGCFDAKPLLPIAPPMSAVAEAPSATGVVPVMVYPKSEADKNLLVHLAGRLGMGIYDVYS